MTQQSYSPAYYIGNNSTAIYPFGFYVSSQSRLKVVQTDTLGVETELTLGADFTVSFVSGNEGVGNVTLVAGNLATGELLAIFNIENIVQDTDIKNQGPYFALDVEKAFDKTARIDQQIALDVQKSIRLPDSISETDFDTALPATLASSAGSAILVNPTGDGFILGIPTGGTLAGVTDTATIDLTLGAGILSADVQTASIVNSHVGAAAAVARTKIASGNANRLVQNDGSGVMADATAITASRALVSDANGIPVAATPTTTELNYVAGVTSLIQTQLDAKLAKAGGTMTGTLVLAGNPSSSNDASNKAYVDALLGGGAHFVTEVRVRTTANGTLATAFENGDTINGIVLATGDRILIMNQTAPAENGVYVVQAAGAPVRATDADSWDSKLVSLAVSVTAGTLYTGTSWLCNVVAGGTLETTAITFVFYPIGQPSQAGDGLQRTDNTISVKLDGATIAASASGIKIPDGGVLNLQIGAGAAIAHSKMASLTASRALASDGSGVVAITATTATELGYVAGATSAIQTQLDAKIPKTLTTTTGDIIYASAANTPARLGAGTNGQVLTLAAGIPSWAATGAAGQEISETVFRGNAAAGSESFTTGAWTPFTLAAAALTSGSPFTRSGNNLTPAFTGKYGAEIRIANVQRGGSSTRNLLFRIKNTTTGATVGKFSANIVLEDSSLVPVFTACEFPVTSITHVHQVQYYSSADSLMSNTAVGGGDPETPPRWEIYLGRLGT